MTITSHNGKKYSFSPLQCFLNLRVVTTVIPERQNEQYIFEPFML